MTPIERGEDAVTISRAIRQRLEIVRRQCAHEAQPVCLGGRRIEKSGRGSIQAEPCSAMSPCLAALLTFSCRECSLWITESADEHPQWNNKSS
jgi:hypothetical protein